MHTSKHCSHSIRVFIMHLPNALKAVVNVVVCLLTGL